MRSAKSFLHRRNRKEGSELIQGFGLRLQEKNLWDFYFSKLQSNSLWKIADRITKYFAKYLWIRRFWKLLLLLCGILEKSLIVVLLSSFFITLLPIWILLIGVDYAINRYHDVITDRQLLKQAPLLIWSCSTPDAMERPSILRNTLLELSQSHTVLLVLPNNWNAQRAFLKTVNEHQIWVIRPAYFFHLRRKIRKKKLSQSIIVYE